MKVHSLLLLVSSLTLVVFADPDSQRSRRAPAPAIPSLWGTKTIRGTSIPFGKWEHSTQCTHIDTLQSAIELPWGVPDHLPDGSSVSIDIIARVGSDSTYPRDSPAFYLWADGKILESSQGTTACPDKKDYSTCLADKSIAKLVSVSIPSTTKRIAILPVAGKCQQTAYRIRTKIPGVCGSDLFRIPLESDNGKAVSITAKDAKAACIAIGAQLTHANWNNVGKIGTVAFNCLGPNGKAFVRSWNGDDLEQDALQVFLGTDASQVPSVNMVDGDMHPPVCTVTRQATFGQELASNIRLVYIPGGILREQALAACQSNGYGLADLKDTSTDGTNEIQDALWELKLAEGKEGAAWIRSMNGDQFWNKCVALALDSHVHHGQKGKSKGTFGNQAHHKNSSSNDKNKKQNRPTLRGHVSQEACDSTKLSAVICQKPDDQSIVDMLRVAE